MGGCESKDGIESPESDNLEDLKQKAVDTMSKVAAVIQEKEPEMEVEEATPEEETIAKIQGYISKLKTYIEKSNGDVEKYKEDAKEAVKNKDNKLAITCLKLVKKENLNIEKLKDTILYMEKQISTIISTKENIDLAKAAQDTLALVEDLDKETKKFGDPSKLVSQILNFSEQLQETSDIVNEIAQTDDAEIEEDLDSLLKEVEAEEANAQAVNMPSVPSEPIPEIVPTPPSGIKDDKRTSYVPITSIVPTEEAQGIPAPIAEEEENEEEDIPIPE